jgi:hypothetical protein
MPDAFGCMICFWTAYMMLLIETLPDGLEAFAYIAYMMRP